MRTRRKPRRIQIAHLALEVDQPGVEPRQPWISRKSKLNRNGCVADYTDGLARQIDFAVPSRRMEETPFEFSAARNG